MSENQIQSGRARFARNTFMQYGLQIAKYLFPLITIPFLTRVLGAEVYAIRAYVLAAMVFAQVFLDYGFTSYGTKVIAECSGDMARMRSESTAIMLLRVLLCVVGAVFVFVISLFIPIMADNLIYVAISYIAVCFKSVLPDYIFQGLEDMDIITHRFVLSQVISTALIFLLISDPNDLILVPVLEVLGAFIAFAWSWQNVLVVRSITFMKVKASKLASVFRESSVYFVSSAATTVFTALTTLMIGVYVSDVAQISYWSIATTAIAAVQSLYTPIVNSLYPHMCIRKDFSLVKKLLMLGLPTVLLGTILFALLGDVVMLVLGGHEFVDGAYLVRMLAPVLFLSFPAMLLGFPVLAAIGKARWLTESSVIAAGFHIAGLLVLAFGGWFTIANVAILRCVTEGVLLVTRGGFSVKAYQEHRKTEGER